MSAAVLTIFLVAFAAAPSKEQQAEAKKHFDEAQLQYKLGRFEEAFVEYQRAYELAPFADLLFNMGQCKRNVKDYERALFFFKSYVREAPSAADRARVNQLIAQLEDERRAEAAAAASVIRPVETSTATSVAAQSEREDRALVAPVERPPEDDPLYTEWWFWTAIGVVAAAAVGGTVLAVSKNDDPGASGTIGTINATDR